MRYSSILCSLSTVVLLSCQAPLSQIQSPVSPTPITPGPTASASSIPQTSPTPSPNVQTTSTPSPISSPSDSVPSSASPLHQSDIVLPLKVSFTQCGSVTSETEIKINGLVIQRGKATPIELFKGAWIERRVVLTPAQLETLKSELTKLPSSAPQVKPADCDQNQNSSQYQQLWQISKADGSQETWTTSDNYQAELHKTLRDLIRIAPPDTTPNTYQAPFWTVMAGECTRQRIRYSFNQDQTLEGPSHPVGESNQITRQLTQLEADQLLAKLQAIDPVKAYYGLVPPLGPFSDITICLQDIESLVVTVNGELKVVPLSGSRLYADNQSALDAYLKAMFGFRTDLQTALAAQQP